MKLLKILIKNAHIDFVPLKVTQGQHKTRIQETGKRWRLESKLL